MKPPLIKRYEGHNKLNDLVRQDWIKSIERSRDMWQAHLYRPKSQVIADDRESDVYESQIVIDIDDNQREIEYHDPIVVCLVESTDDTVETFLTLDSGSETLGEGTEPIMLKVAADPPVEVGSVLEWDEELSEGSRTVFWYVHRNLSVGSARVGTVNVCIPMPNFHHDNDSSEVV